MSLASISFKSLQPIRWVGLVMLLLSSPLESDGQARRDVIQGMPSDLVWYTSVEEAVKAQQEGNDVLALDLSKKRLRELPQELERLSDLTYLLLNRNRLHDLPSWFANLSGLKAVVADHNRFHDFPAALLKMPQVEQVSLGENYLSRIPLDIDAMTHLEILSLWGNVIAQFPATLGNLEHLTVLDLLHNEMTVDEQDFLKELLPQVQLNLSEPCNCEFDAGFTSYPLKNQP